MKRHFSLFALICLLGAGCQMNGLSDQPESAVPMTATVRSQRTPQKADVAAPKVDQFLLRHEQFVERAQQGNVDLLFLGDSITQGWGGQNVGGNPAGQAMWDQHYAPLKAANFGIGGDQTQHVLWRIENGELQNINPKVTVIMIGTNNTGVHSPEQIARGVELIVKTVRTKLPNTKVLLLAIFPRGRTLDDPRMAAIKQINPMIAKLDDGKMVRFLDIGPKFLAPDGSVPGNIMPDFLHLNADGYKIWADSMQPLLTEMMK